MNFVRNIPKNPYHVIDDEAYLLREIKDIRDELNMLKTVFEGQKQVWQHAFKTEDLETFPGYQYNHPTNPSRLLDEIARIAEEASSVQDSVYPPPEFVTATFQLIVLLRSMLSWNCDNNKPVAKKPSLEGGKQTTQPSKPI